MPQALETKVISAPVVYFVMTVLFVGIIWLCISKPIAGILVCGLVIALWIGSITIERRLKKLADDREGESICEFARSFDCKNIDTWIIRAVYEELQSYFKRSVTAFPIRASDRLEEDLSIDFEDVDDILYNVAFRAGYCLDDTESNPLYDKVSKVRDLVIFVSQQPKIIKQEAEQATPPNF